MKPCELEQQGPIRLEEFLTLAENDLENRYELVDGRLFLMERGSPDHSIIGANVGGIFREQTRARRCIAYNSTARIALEDEENCLCPNASVSCDPRDYHALKVVRYPCVVAEVLSPGTKALDRGIKADKYQSIPSIQEILFIDTQIMRVQLWQRQPDCWTMRNFVQGEMVELSRSGIHFLVDEVYEDTTFDNSFSEED
jgi:Uma2 family endonuclease